MVARVSRSGSAKTASTRAKSRSCVSEGNQRSRKATSSDAAMEARKSSRRKSSARRFASWATRSTAAAKRRERPGRQRAVARTTARGSVSQPIPRRPKASAAASVVPEPSIGSRTISLGVDRPLTMALATSRGMRAGNGCGNGRVPALARLATEGSVASTSRTSRSEIRGTEARERTDVTGGVGKITGARGGSGVAGRTVSMSGDSSNGGNESLGARKSPGAAHDELFDIRSRGSAYTYIRTRSLPYRDGFSASRFENRELIGNSVDARVVNLAISSAHRPGVWSQGAGTIHDPKGKWPRLRRKARR